MEYNFNAVLVRNPRKAKADDWQETAHQWRVSINGVFFDYYTGLAHREALRGYAGREYASLARKNLNEHGLAALLGCSKPKPPSLDDVLYALCADSSACDEGFDDWCSNFGYEPDSRKALALYLSCQENASKLRKAGVNIHFERDRLEKAGY